jgi:hypothetical protein
MVRLMDIFVFNTQPLVLSFSVKFLALETSSTYIHIILVAMAELRTGGVIGVTVSRDFLL